MDISTNLKSFIRSEKPNNYFIAPPGVSVSSKPDSTSPVFDMDVYELFGLCSENWSKLPRVQLKSSVAESMKLHFVATTALLRFKDDVIVECVLTDDGKSSLLMASASRIGYSDLGTNAKRIAEWLQILSHAVEKA